MSHGPGELVICSPLDGWCASLADSPDPAFSGRLLGDGVSIDPTRGELVAPCDGVVAVLPGSRHAVTLQAADGHEVLVHVGIDTVGLDGRGFEAFVAAGSPVRRGQRLLTFDLDLLAREAPSLRTPVLLLERGGSSITRLCDDGPVRAGDELFLVSRGADAPAATGRHDATIRRSVEVTLAHGIHARPAADIVRSARRYDATIRIVAADGRAAGADSAVALMSLGVARGAVVVLEAGGPDAGPAADAIAAIVGSEAKRAPAVVQVATPTPAVAGMPMQGRSASGGLAKGCIAIVSAERTVLRETGRGAGEERRLLEKALQSVQHHLAALATSAAGAARDIVDAHALFLDDADLRSRAEEAIAAGESAPVAWQRAVDVQADVLEQLHDERLRERASDLRDVNRRVQRVLAGGSPSASLELHEPSILVADDLMPSLLIEMDRRHLAGIALAGGGVSSHAAILAATWNIPMVVALGDSVLTLDERAEALLDAEAGTLLPQPDEDARADFEERLRREQEAVALAARDAHQPAVTVDGTRIVVLANLASVAEAERAKAGGAEGCGLLRSEFLYLHRHDLPGTAELANSYRAISDALPEGPLVIRLLDAGADKPVPALAQSPEENPALGLRGVRLLLAHPALLESQLAAVLDLRRAAPVEVLVPMVSDVAEIAALRSALAAACAAAGVDTPPRLGAMIETPAAALLADELAVQVDFFSIGTNDLAQYTLAMDRGAGRFAAQLDALHPAVLRLVARVCTAGAAHGIEVSVCGGAASDRLAIPVFLGLGVDKLSVVPAAVARTKAMLRTLSQAGCRALAAEVLALESAGAVRRRVDRYLAGEAQAGAEAAG